MPEELCLTRDLDGLRKELPYHHLRQRKVKTTKEIDWQAEWERFDANELFSLRPGLPFPPSYWKICENARTS